MKPADRVLLVVQQLLVLAVFVWLLLPGPAGRTTLGRPVLAMQWDEAPQGLQSAPLRDARGIRLRADAAHTVADAPLHKLRGPLVITAELQVDRAADVQLPLVSRWSAENGGRSFQLGLQKNLRPYLTVSGNGRKDEPAEFAELNAGVAIPLKRPVHLTAVFAPDERMALFIDGKPVGELTGADKVPSTAYASSAPLTLGGPKATLHGVLGPVHLFDHAVTDQAIAAEAAALAAPARKR